MRRSFLGLHTQVRPSPRALAREMGFPKPSVVQVYDVVGGSPSARAGVAPGDWLLEVDGVPIGTTDEIHRALPRPGATFTLRLLRPAAGGVGGATHTLRVDAEERRG